MKCVVTQATNATTAGQAVEVVERKGIGHPDTLADALAERISVAYSQMCRDAYGAVLHHNLDKVYLRGGHARTALGVHAMTEPVTLEIGGRVSSSFAGQDIAYRELFEKVAREYLATVLPAFDVAQWLKIKHITTDRSRYPTWFRPRSLDDLPELTTPTSSDTVAVAAWAPNTPTEALVLALERYLNREGNGPRYSYLGQDIKVLACRQASQIDVIINVPVNATGATTSGAYDRVMDQVRSELAEVAEAACPGLAISLRVNTSAANPFAAKRHYLLGSGSCLEFGEEGFVGRGNGPSGLIAVQRPKSAEAPFGKNPSYHSGKVYAIYCQHIAQRVHQDLDTAVTVTIAASHSEPLRRPSLVTVDTARLADEKRVREIVTEVLDKTDHISKALDAGCLIPR